MAPQTETGTETQTKPPRTITIIFSQQASNKQASHKTMKNAMLLKPGGNRHVPIYIYIYLEKERETDALRLLALPKP